MADNFELGDTVELKSGGPTMTIEKIGPRFEGQKEQGAHCAWFNEKNQPQKSWFPLTSLKKVNA